MKRFLFFAAVATAFTGFLSSCNREDVGPIQDGRQTFTVSDFDRLDIGSGMDVNVEQGNILSVVASGDQRNLDDLDVSVRNSTLVVKYRTNRSRKYSTTFTITIPSLRGVNFSGGVHSTVKGFLNEPELDIDLSGGSKGDFRLEAARTNVTVSGGAKLQLTGKTGKLYTDASGGSGIQAFDYPADEANINVSGASKAEINVAKALVADASGASHIRYRGNPTNVQQKASGASKIEKD